MENKTINLYANNQTLVIDKIIEIVSDTENYIYANVDLGENWEFDSVRAIWSHGIDVPMVISNGRCKVPADVIADVGVVKVNLVGSNVENGVLVDRLTTEQIPTILVKQNVPIDGTDPQEITPSQFEQFVEAVKEDADRAEQGASDADQSAQNAETSATSASESAESAHNDKVEIEQAIAEVIQQIEDFEQVQVVVNTLPPTSPATSDFTDGVLTLGIPQGAKGDTGNGIQSIAKISTSGLVDTYRITYTDGNSTTFTVTNGEKGDTGNGIVSIEKTSTVGLVDTYTITYTDGNTSTFTVTNGEKGDKGDTGEVTMSQLSALLPTDTASGSIASFPDGTDLFPALSVKAQIEPIQSGSGTPSPDNVRPISGHTECVTQRTGKNLFDIGELIELGTGVSEITNGYRFNVTGAMFNPGVALQKPLTNPVTISMDVANISGKNLRFRVVNIDGTENEPVGSGTGDGGHVEYTAVKPIKGIKFNWSTTGIFEVTNFQMEFGSTATSYEPYQGTTYTTTLGRTVYGGTLDVVSGELTVDRAMVDMGTLDWIVNSSASHIFQATPSPVMKTEPSYADRRTGFVCSCYPADTQIAISESMNNETMLRNAGVIFVRDNNYSSATDFKSAVSGQTLVYELATPQTYQLDPQTIDLLLGQNNVWTDCGSVEVTYKADIERWVNKKINALI